MPFHPDDVPAESQSLSSNSPAVPVGEVRSISSRSAFREIDSCRTVCASSRPKRCSATCSRISPTMSSGTASKESRANPIDHCVWAGVNAGWTGGCGASSTTAASPDARGLAALSRSHAVAGEVCRYAAACISHRMNLLSSSTIRAPGLCRNPPGCQAHPPRCGFRMWAG